jgi:type II secretory pathway pseudopilin PulG
MREIHRKSHGFTLLELLLYFAILSIMLALLGEIGIQAVEDRVHLRRADASVYSADQAMKRIVSVLENTEAIIEPQQGTSNRLVVRMNGQAESTIFSVEDGFMYEQTGAGERLLLSGEESSLGTFSVQNTAETGMPLRIALELEVHPVSEPVREYERIVLTTSLFIPYVP